MKAWVLLFWARQVVCRLRDHRWVWKGWTRRQCLRCGLREQRDSDVGRWYPVDQ